MKKMIIFARSCKNMQDCDRQVKQLKDLAVSKGWEVDAVFREIGSGTKRIRDRKELIRMIEYLQTHHIDKVLVTEFNRLGRDFSQTFEVLVQFNMLGVSLYVQDYAKDTLSKTVLESQQMRLLKISAERRTVILIHSDNIRAM